uniref:PB1-like domain-containing protein n=1 Tax=Lactuca sativa TaxID=4236 RepID=A0A9R1V9L1_LACSA|nr:hypothetical protein LSAT_V11C600299290 [Lactuca sativa]
MLHPTMFSIELHHGGKFTKFPGLRYIEGLVAYIDVVNIEEFLVHEMDSIMSYLGYVVPPVIHYQLCLPNEGLDFGLRALSNDDDVHNLSKYDSENKLIKVYTEHGQTTLVTYFMSPNGPRRVIIEEIEKMRNHLSPYPILLVLNWWNLKFVRLSRCRGWKPTKGSLSCSKKLCLDWVDKGGIGVVEGDQVVDSVTTNADVEMVENLVNEGVKEGHIIANEGVEEGHIVVNEQHQANEVPFENNYSIEEEMLKDLDFDPFYGV